LTTKKKIAVVPTTVAAGRPLGSTHIWNGGWPACATWAVNPATTPSAAPTTGEARRGVAIRPPREVQSR
jgi:hypothetical protein